MTTHLRVVWQELQGGRKGILFSLLFHAIDQRKPGKTTQQIWLAKSKNKNNQNRLTTMERCRTRKILDVPSPEL
jgi:hypothetical protein